MRKYLILLLIPFLLGAAPQRLYTYVPNTTISSTEVTANEDAIFNYLQAGVEVYSAGTIVNASVSTTAAIDDIKLDLATVAQNIQFNGTSTFAGTATFNAASTFASDVTFVGQTIADLGNVTTATITALDGLTTFTALGNLDIGAYDFRANTLIADDLTATRMVFTTTNGQLTDDSDCTFSTDTLTCTKLGAFTAAGAINYNNENMTNVDIDSGAVDDVTIAGASAHGEIFYNDGSNAVEKLANGSDGQVLTSAGVAAPAWESLGVELTGTGNFGGGAGTDSGAVTITAGAKHMVVLELEGQGAGDQDILLRFNSDSGADYVNVTAATNGIDLVDPDTNFDTSGSGIWYLYFSTPNSGNIYVTGQGTYLNGTPTLENFTIGGYFTDGPATTVEVITATNVIGVLAVYKLNDS